MLCLRTLILAAALLALLPGCESREQRLQKIVQSCGGSGGRAGAAAAVGTLIQNGESPGEIVEYGLKLLEDLKNGTPVYFGDSLASPNDIIFFAGAVLDALVANEKALNTGDMAEAFWMRVGYLACLAADEAMSHGDAVIARTVVLAGPKRWQHNGYWLMNPGHDALTSAVLAANGETAEAIRRLDQRAEQLDPMVQGVYDRLKSGR